MLAREFGILKAKDEALSAKDEAITEEFATLKAKVDRKDDALTAEVAALKAKVGALRKGCATGSFKKTRPSGLASQQSDWNLAQTVHFGRTFSGIPKVTASISQFERTQDVTSDTVWGIDLSVRTPSATSVIIDVHSYSTYIPYITVSWVACAA